MALLDIRNLSVEFKTNSGYFRAVDRLSLSVQPAHIHAIVGESGSGKSVAMLAIMGLLPNTARITADEITFDGKDFLTMAPSEKRKIIGKDITMIFQEPMTSLNPCFTVGFQLMEGLQTHFNMDKATRTARAVELLHQVGIPDPQSRLNAYPHQFSGGMAQRVMIAMALACKPKFIIADEPTTALDVTIQAQILDLLIKLQRETQTALVLITHSMGVVAETAETVSVFYAGQKVEERPVADLFARPAHPYTAALLASLPERNLTGRLHSIKGTVPGQFDRPKGCLFSPRCAYATDYCRTVAPERHNDVLCHYPLTKDVAA
jgi:dipeptide transport system ATP-binding protein